jgi:hypothetical protein
MKPKDPCKIHACDIQKCLQGTVNPYLSGIIYLIISFYFNYLFLYFSEQFSRRSLP